MADDSRSAALRLITINGRHVRFKAVDALLSVLLLSPLAAQADVVEPELRLRTNGVMEAAAVVACAITGGTDAGRNRFHRFSEFDTRGDIQRVLFDSGQQRNLVVGVTSAAGSFIDKSIELSSPANLFWLSPGGIHLSGGAGFVNVPSLTLSTAPQLGFSGGGVFDVFGSTADQVSTLTGLPLPGSSGLLDPLGTTAAGLIKMEGVDIAIDQSLYADAVLGDLEVRGSRINADSADGVAGSVTLTSERVGIDGQSSISADGPGGLIQVVQLAEQRPDGRQAQTTVVMDGSDLSASALVEGDGGDVVGEDVLIRLLSRWRRV